MYMYVSSEYRTIYYISVHGRVIFLASLLIIYVLPLYMYTDKLYSLRLIKYKKKTLLGMGYRGICKSTREC